MNTVPVILAAMTAGFYCGAMSVIAEQLDAKLNTLDAKAASSLERLVRDALELMEIQNGAARSERLPPDFFTRIAGEFGVEPFERPPQGESGSVALRLAKGISESLSPSAAIPSLPGEAPEGGPNNKRNQPVILGSLRNDRGDKAQRKHCK